MAGYGITGTLSAPLYSGLTATSDEIPGLYAIGLNGRGFLLDLKSDRFYRQSIPLLRDQSDQASQPGESSVNPDDLWRRAPSSWHQGAGQRNFDSATSAAGRFYASKGIDPWTNGVFSLLPAVDEKKTSANSNLALAVAGDYLYLIDGGSIQYTQDVTVGSPTWTDITGEPANSPTAITSDGFSIYTAHGASGIYVTTRGGASTASGVTGTVAGVKYVKGRLFAWSTDKIYNITSTGGGALPTALLDHANSDFTWVDVAEAPGVYLLAGYSGDKTTIYRTAVKADGTALDTPTVAAELPDGEIVRSMQGYLGFVLIGTNKGIRFGQPDGDGNLELGGLIDDALDVRCFEGQDRFVWFGWSQYDATSTGLGRMDLSVFNGSRPAYASDLMATENGNVLSVVTFQGIRVFTVSADGVFAQDTPLVASGTLETGRISYGIFDSKVSLFVNVNHEPLAGSIDVEFKRDNGDYAFIGTQATTVGSVQSDFPTSRARAENFDIRLTLTRASGDTATGPTIGRVTLRSSPAAQRSERIFVPLLLGKNQKLLNGSVHGRSVTDDLTFLAALEDGSPVSYQEASLTYTVIVEDHDWRPHHIEDDRLSFNGTYNVQLKRFATE
jgi:hypothetical protein